MDSTSWIFFASASCFVLATFIPVGNRIWDAITNLLVAMAYAEYLVGVIVWLFA